MSTRSVIGILNEDGTVTSIYSHYDGYPEHNGYFLKKYFDTTEKVQNLISNGDISSLVSNQNWQREKHPMINNKQVLKTLYYVDRPEPWEQIKPQKHNNQIEFFSRDCCDEFKYLFIPPVGAWNYLSKGFWKCYDTTNPTQGCPSVKIPDTSNYFDDTKQLFVYGFSKVSRVKELTN
tara:strand:- start:404 stop:934 length:531 start_codon:yes stop_codon:yes gene_type:complete